MFVIAAFSLFTNLFREARIFFYIGLTGILVLSLVILGTSNRDLKETGVSQLFSLILSFLFLPIFLAFPVWIIFPNINWFDAYLDMVSALTTTGFPVLEKEDLSQPVHLWRALVAWFGGGLIWIAAFVILLPVNFGGLEIFSNDKNSKNSNRKLTLDERSMTLIKVSKKLIPIYLGLTVALWGCLTSLGTDGYTSLIRALSVVSTSGISGPEKFGLDGAGFTGELVIVLFLLLAISNNIIKIFNELRDNTELNFNQLLDITAVDYPSREFRFDLIYILQSLTKNKKIILKTFIKENENIESITNIHKSADWYERECYDLFGIEFINHPDLRRIMTDYNFEGYPLRKDFPLTGHTEVRYDDLEKKVIYEPVKLTQEFRNFDSESPWEGMENKLFGDEKSTGEN